jgi:hypothetical protein
MRTPLPAAIRSPNERQLVLRLAYIEAFHRSVPPAAPDLLAVCNEELMTEPLAESRRLCYLSATHVEGPLPTFDRVEVRSRENRRIGRLDGIIIDPAERQVRYLVVDAATFFTHHRYVLPLASTQIDAERPSLRVDFNRDDLTDVDEFDAAAFPTFSDEDLITALFARPHA